MPVRKDACKRSDGYACYVERLVGDENPCGPTRLAKHIPTASKRSSSVEICNGWEALPAGMKSALFAFCAASIARCRAGPGIANCIAAPSECEGRRGPGEKRRLQAVVFTVVNLSVAHRPEVCRDERSGLACLSKMTLLIANFTGFSNEKCHFRHATVHESFVDDGAKLADGAIDRKHGLAVDVGLQKPTPAR